MTIVQSIAGKGWRPQKYDHRDRLFNLEEKVNTVSQVPGKVDPLTANIDAYNQLRLGSCVGNGTARVMEYIEMKEGEGTGTPSRLFIYRGARVIEGTVSQDSGAEIRDGIKVVASDGAPPETLWPYSDANPGPFQQQPPQSVYDAAKKYEALQYQLIVAGPGAPFRTAISRELPIVFGFNVPATFEDGSWDPVNEVLPMPKRNTGYIGGHCVVADGYDFTCKDFPVPFWWCANSWDHTWGAVPPNSTTGKAGWFRMHAHYFPGIASDFWVVSKTS